MSNIIPFPSSSPHILFGGVHPVDLQIESEPGRRFQLVLWATPDGHILSHALVPADQPLTVAPPAPAGTSAPASLRAALDAFPDQAGGPADTCVVNSEELLAVLQDHGALPASVGPTPQTEEAAASFNARFGAPPGLVQGDVRDQDGEGLMGAAGILWRMRPWERMAQRFDVLGAEVREPGWEDTVVHVLGRAGLEFGIAVFPTFVDWRVHTRVGIDAMGHPLAPSFLSLTFDAVDAVPPSVVEEARQLGWDGPDDRVPGVFAIRHGEVVPLDRTDVRVLTVVASGLATFSPRLTDPTATPEGLGYQVQLGEGRDQMFVDLLAPAPQLAGAQAPEGLDAAPSLDELVETYLQHRGESVSEATVDQDRRILEDFLDHCDEADPAPHLAYPSPDLNLLVGDPSQVFGPELFMPSLLEFLIDTFLVQPHTSSARLVRTLRVLRGFARFLAEQGWLIDHAARTGAAWLEDGPLEWGNARNVREELFLGTVDLDPAFQPVGEVESFLVERVEPHQLRLRAARRRVRVEADGERLQALGLAPDWLLEVRLAGQRGKKGRGGGKPKPRFRIAEVGLVASASLVRVLYLGGPAD